MFLAGEAGVSGITMPLKFIKHTGAFPCELVLASGAQDLMGVDLFARKILGDADRHSQCSFHNPSVLSRSSRSVSDRTGAIDDEGT